MDKQIKKLLIAMIALCLSIILFACNEKENEPHWSYKACINELIPDGVLNYSYTYTVKEIKHNEIAKGDDEIHCFDITITKSAGKEVRYCCFAVVSDGDVVYVDCDKWEANNG